MKQRDDIYTYVWPEIVKQDDLETRDDYEMQKIRYMEWHFERVLQKIKYIKLLLNEANTLWIKIFRKKWLSHFYNEKQKFLDDINLQELNKFLWEDYKKLSNTISAYKLKKAHNDLIECSDNK